MMSNTNDSEGNKDVFSGKNYAEDYRKGRPTYPETLIDAILVFLRLKVNTWSHFFFFSTNFAQRIACYSTKMILT